MKIAALIMSVLFAYSVIVQYNDPDSLLWVLIYGYPLVLSALLIFNKWSFLFHFVAAIVFILAFIPYLFYAEAFSFDNERFREAGGLLICGFWLLCTSYWIRKKG